jgi:hypothetical protein
LPNFSDGESVQSSKGLLHVIVNDNGDCIGPYQPTTGNLDVTHGLHEGALQFLANQHGTQPSPNHNVFDNKGNLCHSVLQITSECKGGNETFQAHCNYQNKGPWYDWVMFRWESNLTRRPECCVKYLDNLMVTQTHDYAPRQLVRFVVCPVPNETEPSQILALLKTCCFLHNKNSIFSTIWHQEFDDLLQTVPSLVLVNVDCMSILVIRKYGIASVGPMSSLNVNQISFG